MNISSKNNIDIITDSIWYFGENDFWGFRENTTQYHDEVFLEFRICLANCDTHPHLTPSRTTPAPLWLQPNPCLTSCSRSLLQILTCFCYLYKDLEVTLLVENNIQGCHHAEENAGKEKLTFLLLLLFFRGWGSKEEEIIPGWPQVHY